MCREAPTASVGSPCARDSFRAAHEAAWPPKAQRSQRKRRFLRPSACCHELAELSGTIRSGGEAAERSGRPVSWQQQWRSGLGMESDAATRMEVTRHTRARARRVAALRHDRKDATRRIELLQFVRTHLVGDRRVHRKARRFANARAVGIVENTATADAETQAEKSHSQHDRRVNATRSACQQQFKRTDTDTAGVSVMTASGQCPTRPACCFIDIPSEARSSEGGRR